MKKNIIELSLVFGFATVFILLMLAGGQMYGSLHEYMATLRMVEHTHQVIRTLTAVTSTLREMESGQRAYIITHDDIFRAENSLHQSEVRYLLARIRELTVDNQLQQVRGSELTHRVEERLQLLDKAVIVYQGFEV